jgi:hypothetical protein
MNDKPRILEWKDLFILQMMTGRNYMYQPSQFINRSQGPVDGRFFKNKFTPEEDAALLQLVTRFGTTDWKKIATYMPTRNVRQCRERYKNYLDPELRQGAWTHDEDMLLIEQFTEHGAKWNTIAQAFINRSDLALRNRWQVLERRMTKTGKTAPVVQPIEQPAPDVAPIEEPARPASPFTFTGLFDFEVGINDDPFDSWSMFY